MGSIIDVRSEIPEAGFYVLCNDRFMSGWGRARDKINTIVLPCRDFEQAERVERYARSRGDQSRVRIVRHKPRLRAGVVYSLLTEDNASAWFR